MRLPNKRICKIANATKIAEANAKMAQQPDGVYTPGWKYDQKLGMTPAQAELQAQKQQAQQPAAPAQQQAQAHQANLIWNALNGRVMEPKRWMIDGKAMDFDEFINELYPEDCAEKTLLILKLKKE